MKLLASYTSPYARKIRIISKLLSIEEQITLEVENPFASSATLTEVNPLSKVPALLLDNGQAIVGSALITDYLCANFDGDTLLPKQGDRRWEILRHAAIAEGIIDAAVTHVFESRRPADKQMAETLSRQYEVINRALNSLGKSSFQLSVGNPTNYEVTLAAALGYLDFRHTGVFNANISHDITRWFSEFNKLPCMVNTQPPA